MKMGLENKGRVTGRNSNYVGYSMVGSRNLRQNHIPQGAWVDAIAFWSGLGQNLAIGEFEIKQSFFSHAKEEIKAQDYCFRALGLQIIESN